MKKLILCAVATVVAGAAWAGDYPFQPAEMTNVAIRAGFWLPRFETNRIVTVWSDFKKSEETGRIANFENAGKRKGKFVGIAENELCGTVAVVEESVRGEALAKALKEASC